MKIMKNMETHNDLKPNNNDLKNLKAGSLKSLIHLKTFDNITS